MRRRSKSSSASSNPASACDGILWFCFLQSNITCMAPRENLIGRKFSAVTIIDFAPKRNGRTAWLCRCDCGHVWTALQQSLVVGDTTGCYDCGRKSATAKMITHGYSAHGKKSGEYNSWQNAKDRCFNEKAKMYPWYGARGITMCERWKDSFENFIADMGDRPTKYHSLDRINVHGNYEPGNCKWSTKAQQNNNKQSSIRFSWKGETRSLMEIAVMETLHYECLRYYIRIKGFDLDAAIQRVKNPLWTRADKKHLVNKNCR